jgi:hypothetical protein
MTSSEPATVLIEHHSPPGMPGYINWDPKVSNDGEEVRLFGDWSPAGHMGVPVITRQPGHGTLRQGYAYEQFYAPQPGYVGVDYAEFVLVEGNLSSKPFRVTFHVTNPGSTSVWSSLHPSYQFYFRASPFDPVSYTPQETTFIPALPPESPPVTIKMYQSATYGNVSLSSLGGFTYTPTSSMFRGWDYFAFVYVVNGVTVSAPNWIIVDVDDNYVFPAVANPPETLRPETFPSTLKGLWQSYNAAKQKQRNVAIALADFGASAKALADASEPTDALIDDGIRALDIAVEAFNAYSVQAAAALKAAGEYMKGVWFTTQADFDVLAAINALPRDIAGLKPDQKLIGKWQMAIASYAAGADFMLANNSFVVEMAVETHDAMESALQFGGIAAIGITGAQLLTQEGCKAFAGFAVKQIVYLGIGVGTSLASQQAIRLAQEFGVNPDYIRIGADALQLYFLLKAAKAQRDARGAACFTAGTEVITQYGPVPIEQLQVGQRVLTAAAASVPGAPPPVFGEPDLTAVDPATWRLVSLRMPDPKQPGNAYEMQLLEPLSWIEREQAQTGGWVYLSLPELEIHGSAQVLSITDSPPIESGYGRVILGTFTYVSHDVLEVKLAGLDDPLEVTAGHPLWSLVRGRWVKAGELHAGELLATQYGSAAVEYLQVLAGEHRVYNLDIEADHRYLVTELGVVAHNAGPCDASVLQTGGRTLSPRTQKALADRFGAHPKRIGRALEELKANTFRPPNHHGKIWSNGDYTEMDGTLIGNIGDYL